MSEFFIVLLASGIIGLIGGFASGLFGIGGGSIRIPLLNLVGFTLLSAYGMNLMALPITCSTGAFCQKSNIDNKIGKYMILGGSLGTLLGTLIVFSFATSELWLAVFFVIASIIAVVAMNLSSFTSDTSDYFKPSPSNLTTGTLLCNTLTGMRGGSEGSLFVPLLRLLKVDMHKAVATSLFAAVFTSIVGVFLYFSQEYLLWVEGIALIIGSIIGSKIGSSLSVKTKSRSLEIGLSIVIIILSFVTIFIALSP